MRPSICARRKGSDARNESFRSEEGLAPLALRNGPASSKIRSSWPTAGSSWRTDAATYIIKLPTAEQDLDRWQIAVEQLIRAAEAGGGCLMLARIGVPKALRRNVVRSSTPTAKRRIGASGS
jgi:hypothetical protein